MYKLPQHINSNKIFIINRSELEDRFDPDMVLYRKKTNSFRYNAVSLKSLLKVQPQYGANESGIVRQNIEEPRYIRITDIDEYGQLIDSIGVTAETIESKYILANNDILFARSGATVGKAYLHQKENVDYECFFAGYMIRFVADESKILPKYLFTYTQLSPYKAWVKAIQRTAAQPNINAEEYKSLLIPLPPISLQKDIVQIINEAYSIKQQKESQAQKLLASIDDYLLGELGIVMPVENEINEPAGYKDFNLDSQNPLVKNGRLFLTRFSEVGGGRFDPINSLYLGKKSKSRIYENVSLREIAVIEKGQSITSKDIVEGEYPVIAGGQISPYSHNKFNNKANVITISASGAYSGFVWYHDYPIFASDCSVIRSKNEDIFSTKYIFEVLKAKQKEIYLLQQGAGQPHVYPADLAKILIPIVSSETQNKLTDYINSLRQQAQQLQNDAAQALQQAKEKVEQMILGE